MLRAIRGCIVYSFTTAQERRSIDEKSQFNYIKSEVESFLNDDEEKRFVRFLTSYKMLDGSYYKTNHRIISSTEALPREGNVCIAKRSIKHTASLRKIGKFLGDERYGERLSRLIYSCT